MGDIRHINGVYYIEFYARGLLYSQVAGTDFQAAQKMLQQVEEKIAGGEALTIVRHIDLADFFERFLSQAKELYRPKTVERFQSTIKHFQVFLKTDYPQILQLAEITPSVAESYKAYLVKTQKPKLVNLTILLLRDILEYGIKLGFLNDNPSLHVRLADWPKAAARKSTPRQQMARQLLSRGTSLGKLAQLLKIEDIARLIYFSSMIPLSREDAYN